MSYHKAQQELDKPGTSHPSSIPACSQTNRARSPVGTLGVQSFFGCWHALRWFLPPLLIPQIMVLKGQMAESDGVGNMEVQGGILKDLFAEAKLS